MNGSIVSQTILFIDYSRRTGINGASEVIQFHIGCELMMVPVGTGLYTTIMHIQTD